MTYHARFGSQCKTDSLARVEGTTQKTQKLWRQTNAVNSPLHTLHRPPICSEPSDFENRSARREACRITTRDRPEEGTHVQVAAVMQRRRIPAAWRPRCCCNQNSKWESRIHTVLAIDCTRTSVVSMHAFHAGLPAIRSWPAMPGPLLTAWTIRTPRDKLTVRFLSGL